MNVRNSKWPPELTRVLKNGAPLKWPQDWSNKQSQCVECEHPPSEHSIIEGGDRIKRVFCGRCPLRRTVLMGDEGSDAPVPFSIEGPFSTTACFQDRQVATKGDNFLPLSSSSQGTTTFMLQATTPDGKKITEIEFAGVSWQPGEFERLVYGDEVDKNPRRYKLHLYWLQDGRCAGCRRTTHFDRMEIDRIVPGSAGPGYVVGNVQLLCSSCNKLKGDRSMQDLMVRLRMRGLPRDFNQAEVTH